MHPSPLIPSFRTPLLRKQALRMDLDAVLAALSALSNRLEETRQAAQLQLYAWSQQPGLSAALATIMATPAVPLGPRRWAAIFLKEQIRDNWLSDGDDDDAEAAGGTELTYDENGQIVKTTTLNAAAMAAASLNSAHESYLEAFSAIHAITIPEEDKAVVRNTLPALLADPNPQIRTLAGNCIAAVASHDWPDEWPELLNGLIGMVTARASVDSVQGALRCLLLFAEDLADERLLAALPALLPAVLGILTAGDGIPPGVRACALQLYSTCITALTYLEDAGSKAFERAMTSYVTPTLQPMLSVISELLARPLPVSSGYSAALAPAPQVDSPAAAAAAAAAAPFPTGNTPPVSEQAGSFANATAADTLFSVRAEAVRALGQLIAFFPKLMKPLMDQIPSAVFSAFAAAAPLYVEYAVFADANEAGDDAEADDDDAFHGISAYLLSCLGVLTTLAEDPRSSGGKLLRLALPQLALPLGALLMLPAAEVAVFESDANAFIEREDTSSSADAAPEGSRSYSTGEDADAGGAAAGGVAAVRDEVLALVGLMVERWPLSATAAFAAASVRLAALGDEMHARTSSAVASGAISAAGAAAAAAAGIADAGALVRGWWKPREAGTLLLGQITDTFPRQTVVTLETALNDFVITGYNQSLPASIAAPGSAASGAFLAARVAWVLAPLSGMLSRSVIAALSAPGAAPQAAAAAAQGHGTLAQLTTLLTQCLSGPLHVAVSATRTVRAAGVALGAVDDAVLAAGSDAVNALPNLQGPALAAWLPALCAQAQQARGPGAVLYSALAALAWACFAAGKWHEQTLSMAATAAGGSVAELAKISGVAAATRHVLVTHPVVADLASKMPQGPVAAVGQAVSLVAGAVLAAWQTCPMDHVVAEHVLESVQGLAVLPGAGSVVSEMIIPSVIPLLGNDDVPATVKMVAMNLASILIRATAPPQPQGDVLNLATHAPAAELPAQAGTALRSVADATAASRKPSPFGPSPAALAAGTVFSPAVALGGLLPAVLELGFNTDESHLVRGCAAITATTLAIYGPVIRDVLASPTGENPAVAPGVTADALRARIGRGAPQLLQRFIVLSQDPGDVDIVTAADLNVSEDAPRVSEHTLAPAGRLATQLLACYCDVMGPATAESLLGAITRKVLTAQMLTLKIALLLAFARAVIRDPVWVFSALQNMGNIEMTSVVREKPAKKAVGKKKAGSKRGGASAGGVKLVTRQVPALAALMNVWLNVGEGLYSQYLCQVTSAAMSTLLSLPEFVSALSQIPVDGPTPPSAHQGGGPATRSRGMPAPVKIPALHKMIAVLAEMTTRVGSVQARAVDRLLGRAPARGEDEDEDEDLADLAMLQASDDSDIGDDDEEGGEDDDGTSAKSRKAERKLKRSIEKNLRGRLDADDVFADAGDFDMSRFEDLLAFDEMDNDMDGGTTGAAFDTTADEEDFPEYAYDVLFHTDAATLGLSVFAGLDMATVQAAAQAVGGKTAEAIGKCMHQCGRA